MMLLATSMLGFDLWILMSRPFCRGMFEFSTWVGMYALWFSRSVALFLNEKLSPV